LKTGPRIIGRATVAKSRLFRVDAVDLEFSNGAKRQFEQLVGSGDGGVLVVPVSGDDLLLVEEYALGVGRYELGFVKGVVETGEAPEITAQRELAEEIGLRADRLTPLGSFTLMPAYSDFDSHIFLASALRPERRSGDEPEPLKIHRWPLAAIDELRRDARVTDARTHLALFLAAAHFSRNPDHPDDSRS
jgi:ADP-ribose diphosphatase